jgi:hypothetical protein
VRVIEVTHVEGQRKPVVTIDGEPMPEWWSVTAHMDRKGTQIFINGSRVTEPTRIVRSGIIAIQDNADDDLVWRAQGRLYEMLSASMASIDTESPFKVPDMRGRE